MLSRGSKSRCRHPATTPRRKQNLPLAVLVALPSHLLLVRRIFLAPCLRPNRRWLIVVSQRQPQCCVGCTAVVFAPCPSNLSGALLGTPSPLAPWCVPVSGSVGRTASSHFPLIPPLFTSSPSIPPSCVGTPFESTCPPRDNRSSIGRRDRPQHSRCCEGYERQKIGGARDRRHHVQHCRD